MGVTPSILCRYSWGYDRGKAAYGIGRDVGLGVGRLIPSLRPGPAHMVPFGKLRINSRLTMSGEGRCSWIPARRRE